MIHISECYLSNILIAFFDIFCSTNNQLVNIVYLCFLSQIEIVVWVTGILTIGYILTG